MNINGSPLFHNKDFQLFHHQFEVGPGISRPFSQQDPVSIIFYLQGPVGALYLNGKEAVSRFLVKKHCHLIRLESARATLRWNAPGKVELLTIHLTEKYFKKLFSAKNNLPADSLLTGKNGIFLQQKPMIAGKEMSDIIYSISKASERPVSLKTLILEAKTMELIAVYIEQLLHFSRQEKPPARHSYLATQAKQYIDKHIGKKEFTIIGLAKMLDTNETTLKQAFKEAFAKTIFRYFQEKRMQIAIQTLQSGKTVSAASANCGYSHIAHFSVAFKKEFGIPPSEFIHQ